MATRYWVGGSGTWDTTNTANWSATSGGAGGASVPTSADAVIINNNSIVTSTPYTITCSSGVCATLTTSITTSTKVVTLSGTLTVSGNVSIGAYTTQSLTALTLSPSTACSYTVSGASISLTGSLVFSGNVTYTLSISPTTQTITYVVNAGTINGSFGTNGTPSLTVAGGSVTTGGSNFSSVTVSGGTLTMSGALTCSTATVTGGTLARATYSLTCSSSFNCSGTTARAISGTGTNIILSGTGTVFSCDNATNLTLTNPQTIQLSNATATTKVANGPTTGDTASNTFTISNGGAAGTAYDITGAFLDLSITGAAAKNISNQTRKIYGNWSDGVNITYTAGPLATTFAATTTGKTAAFAGATADFPLIFDGVGGAWTLTWANTTTSVYSDITLTNGSLTFSGVNNFFKSLNSSNTNTRTLVLPSPGNTLTLSGTVPIDFTTGTNLTLTPGTGVIDCTNATATFNGGGKTFYIVRFINTALDAVNITGANTFNSLSTVARAAAGIGSITLFANQTCTNISLTGGGGTAASSRLFVKSDTLGTTRTISGSGGSRTAVQVDFRDITVASAFATLTLPGNCGGNTGITFPAAKTVYWKLTAGGNWSATAWAPTSGGTAVSTNFPLPQDTAVIDETGLTTGNTITINAAYNLPEINSTRTSTWTLAGSSNNTIYNNFLLSFPMTFSCSGTLTFGERGGFSDFQTNGVSVASLAGIVIESIGGTVTINSGLDMANDPLIVRRGTFRQFSDLTCGAITVESTATGFEGTASSTITCTDWTFPTTGPTLTIGNLHTISFSGTFAGGNKTSYFTVQPRNATSNTITGSNTFVQLSRPPVGSTLNFAASSTQTISAVGSFLTGGSTSGSRIFLRSTVSGTRFNLSKSSGTVNVNSLDIQDSNATGGAIWNAPTSNNNLNSGNNLGWIFGAIASTGFFMLF